MAVSADTVPGRRIGLWGRVVCGDLLLTLAGCQGLAYYGQVAGGQMRLMHERQPVDELLADLRARVATELAPAGGDRALLLQRLAFSQALLDFAEETLTLPVGRRYRTYVALDRPYVVWNLFAAPELSLDPNLWCYPLVGCAPYRGYFDQARAELEAGRLRDAGLETYLGGVAAYSTLGWFADPLLSSFLRWPEPQLAQLLIHELAHGVVWVKGDVAFNESFATFVGRAGVETWYGAQGPDPAADVYAADLASWLRLQSLLERLRQALAPVYRSALPEVEKMALKANLLAAARSCYRSQLSVLGAGRHDGLMAVLNNAVLVSLGTYQDRVPAFEAMFERAHGDWPAFLGAVRALAALPQEARAEALAREALAHSRSADQQVADRGDDAGANQVECEALARHGFDGEPTGTVDDDVGGGGHGEHEGA